MFAPAHLQIFLTVCVIFKAGSGYLIRIVWTVVKHNTFVSGSFFKSIVYDGSYWPDCGEVHSVPSERSSVPAALLCGFLSIRLQFFTPPPPPNPLFSSFFL